MHNIDYSEKNLCSFGSAGSGGGGGTDTNVTTTTTNPVVPDEAKPLMDALMGISTAMTGSPVNFGKIPGLDAPQSGPLIPQPSMGSMFASTPFNRFRVTGQPIGGASNRFAMTQPMPRPPAPVMTGKNPSNTGSWGDMYNRAVTNNA